MVSTIYKALEGPTNVNADALSCCPSISWLAQNEKCIKSRGITIFNLVDIIQRNDKDLEIKQLSS